MWNRLSLRSRLLLLLTSITLGAFILCLTAFLIYARHQLAEEQVPRIEAVREVAATINRMLANADDPDAVLRGFVAALPRQGVIGFEQEGVVAGPRSDPDDSSAPAWFIELLGIPEAATRFPLQLKEKPSGDLVFRPDYAADISEKWIVFLALTVGSLALCLIASLAAFRTASVTLTPLGDIASVLTRLRSGDYGARVSCAGAPEFVASCRHLNDLGETLHALTADNRDLMRRLVLIQDEERKEIARELHDELGPLLFAIRANTTALVQQKKPEPGGPGEKILEAVERLQQTNRRILTRLRPMHVEELGLERSIQALARDAQRLDTSIDIAVVVDPGVKDLDPPVSQTIYRVAQEALTNIMRHAAARHARVELTLSGQQVELVIMDDGRGPPSPLSLGRGLTGMRERVRALNGLFEIRREAGSTIVRCVLPMAVPAPVQTAEQLSSVPDT